MATLRDEIVFAANNAYYTAKAMAGSDTVTIDGIQIAVGDPYFSKNMKRKIREGRYERTERKMLKKHLLRDTPVIDLGAGIGYTACLEERLVASHAPVIAVEANPELIHLTEKTRAMNGCSFHLINAAYSTKGDSIELRIAKDFWASSQYDRGQRAPRTLTVPAVTVADLLEQFGLRSFQLVMDIEGGEFDLFANEMDVIRSACRLLVVEFHDYTEHDKEQYRRLVEHNGFTPIASVGHHTTYANRSLATGSTA